MATKFDVVAQALHTINRTGYEEAPSGEDNAIGLRYLEQVFADLNGAWGGCTLPFTIDQTITAPYVFPLAQMLAVRLAPIFERPPPEAEKTALVRVRAVNLPYVRDLDLDDDGVVTDEETAIVDRSAYY